jgi:hypothetical protein
VELAAGYTNARYTRDSQLGTSTQPVVSAGDAIAGESGSGQNGQPSAPYTVSLGLEYKFKLFNRESFVRVDDEFESRPKWPTATQDPTTLQFDSANYILSSTNFASARAGMNFGGWQAALFVDNLTDTHTVTNYEWSIDPGDGNSRLERQFTFRPRTIGITVTYRN